MASATTATAGAITPTAVVWCRQVDNEAESPGYTTIPEEFPGRRETLETIRLVGSLTINVADTHDYWDPDPSQPLSYYPNLFLYPAANGRYTCVGRMFLSTEDRPRLGMKTLVFPTVELVASGEFGSAVLRAHAGMGGRSTPARPLAEPEPSVYQAVGEGFVFHRGSTEPVVVVASDQWESAAQVVNDLVRLLPSSLVTLSAFLVFPYFLPEAKVNLHEFTEQLPLALAVMRVPRSEAQGDRHAKRLQSWQIAPVGLRDLTRPASPRAPRENLPLVLQYARDHLEQKLGEVGRRVDLVEGARTRTHLHDPDHQGGRDRRKEMWRIGTAMETAALLLARPKGRTVPMTGEAARRANEYLRAVPPTAVPPSPPPAAPTPAEAPASVPAWLRRPLEVNVPPPGPVDVPVSVSDDPSAHAAPTPVRSAPPTGPSSAPAPPAAAPAPAPVARSVVPSSPVSLPPSSSLEPERPLPPRVEPAPPAGPSGPELAEFEARFAALLDRRLRDAADQTARGLLELKTDLSGRLAAVEGRPVVDPQEAQRSAEARLTTGIDALTRGLDDQVRRAVQQAGERWAERLREELRGSLDGVVTGLDERTQQAVQRAGERWAERLKEELRGGLDSVVAGLDERTQQAIQLAGERSATRLREEMRVGLDAVVASVDERTQQASQLAAERSAARLREEMRVGLDALVVDLSARTQQEVQRGGERWAERLKEELRGGMDAALASLDERARKAAQQVGERWAERLREELRGGVEELKAQSLRAEEELRVALVTQLDLELAETRDQATALRESIESRVRDLLKEQVAELDQRRAKEYRELEHRLSLLIDGRTRDLESRLKAAFAEQQARTVAVTDERAVQSEHRIANEREARLSELAEAQTQAIAGLQVRLQAFFEQKLRENQEQEREKYVELLARLKVEVDQSLARTMDSTEFESVVRDRVLQALDASRSDQERGVASALADAEARLRQQQEEGAARLERIEAKLQHREGELARLERNLRHEAGDLDRRLQVLSDRMMPVVRKTWLKVAELEKGGGTPEEGEARLGEVRRELTRELRRVEGELLEQTAELRERLEGTIAHQGRIWLNLLRQMSSDSGEGSGSGRRSGRRTAPAPEEYIEEPFGPTDLRGPGYTTLDDPPNPMSPPLENDLEPQEPRRRGRRA